MRVSTEPTDPDSNAFEPIDALPDRPLRPREVESLLAVDGVEVVREIEVPGVARGSLLVVETDENSLVLGWDPGGKGWALLDRNPRD